jgi:hypothetical protein
MVFAGRDRLLSFKNFAAGSPAAEGELVSGVQPWWAEADRAAAIAS